jgi:hypothetical protein
LFLFNLISYALLPGLVYSVFRRLQVSRRVAWWWMWSLPAAFCYALQAGTLATDSVAAVYALASVAFALQARTSRQVSDLWFSMLAMALATGVKQSNLPLALLWLIGALPASRLLLKYRWWTAAVVLLSLSVSALPMMCLNLLHDCNWAGIPKHPGPDWETWKNVQSTSAFWSIIGNLIAVPVQNLALPIFPCYQSWNEGMQRFMAELTSCESARYLSPYYPFLLPVILARAGMPILVR